MSSDQNCCWLQEVVIEQPGLLMFIGDEHDGMGRDIAYIGRTVLTSPKCHQK